MMQLFKSQDLWPMQVRSHVQKETEREELTDNFPTMEAVAGSFVPVEETGENGAIPTSNKGSCSTYILSTNDILIRSRCHRSSDTWYIV